MDTTFSKDDLEFQQEVRTFIKENYPQWLRDAIKEKTRTGQEYTKEEVTAWHKILGKHKGWSVPGWSTEYGGPGFTATQKYIFQEEMAKQDTLMVAPFGPVMCAPVIMAFGSAEQKEKLVFLFAGLYQKAKDRRSRQYVGIIKFVERKFP